MPRSSHSTGAYHKQFHRAECPKTKSQTYKNSFYAEASQGSYTMASQQINVELTFLRLAIHKQNQNLWVWVCLSNILRYQAWYPDA